MHVTVDDGSGIAAEDALSTDGSTSDESPRYSRSTRYRYLLALTAELDRPVTIDRLVDPMVHWEDELEGDADGRSWHDIHEELYRVDLPVLDSAGLLEFNVENGLVYGPDRERPQPRGE